MNGNNAEERNALKLGTHHIHSTINGGIYDGALPELDANTQGNLNNQNYDVDSVQLEHESMNSSDFEDIADDIQEYNPQSRTEEQKEEGSEKLEAGGPMTAIQKTKTRFFSPRNKGQRKLVFRRWCMTVLFLGIFCFTVLVLFWGILYRIPDYAKRAKLLAVIQEGNSPYLYNGTLEVPPVSGALPQIIRGVPFTWTILNATQFQVMYNVSSPDLIGARIEKLIYDEKYWAAINVQANATETLVRSLTEPDSNISFNSSNLFEIVYETARELTEIPSVILPPLELVETAFRQFYSASYLPQLLKNVSTSDNINATKLADASNMSFLYNDLRPVTNRQYLIITQVGSVYCVVLTLFQFLLMGPIHQQVAKLVKFRHIWIYRIMMMWSIMFFASLFYCTVTAVYHEDFTRAFGRGGFMVYWMTIYLLMLAVGGANENMVMLIVLVSPSYIGFWILTFVILNLAPSVFTIGFANIFYRYGYAMPLHNAVHIQKVIFFDISRKSLGRNYGVLAAWVGVNTLLLPFVCRFSMKVLYSRAKKEAAAAKIAAAKAEATAS